MKDIHCAEHDKTIGLSIDNILYTWLLNDNEHEMNINTMFQYEQIHQISSSTSHIGIISTLPSSTRNKIIQEVIIENQKNISHISPSMTPKSNTPKLSTPVSEIEQQLESQSQSQSQEQLEPELQPVDLSFDESSSVDSSAFQSSTSTTDVTPSISIQNSPLIKEIRQLFGTTDKNIQN
jgi:hypothetical protein